MKKGSLTLLAVSLALAGCASGTPDCADDETLGLIDQAVREYVEQLAARPRADKEEFRAVADTYSVSNIRTDRYDEDVDSYQCSARITYVFKGQERSVDFSYRVDTEQASGETMIEYENRMLQPIRGFY